MLVVQAQVQLLDVQATDFGGAAAGCRLGQVGADRRGGQFADLLAVVAAKAIRSPR
ncbi:hypothetical protein [Acrocarpospora sp. B8E8]|uniref:hypothetical protein n=1 Tax=Acrocarpospora sp. B8E8 TaxID=3153572 RepID=UPI00325D54B1